MLADNLLQAKNWLEEKKERVDQGQEAIWNHLYTLLSLFNNLIADEIASEDGSGSEEAS